MSSSFFTSKLAHLLAVLITTVSLASLTGCKKKNSSTYTPPPSQLQGGIRDQEYIFMLTPHEAWSEERPIFEFIVCRLQKRENDEEQTSPAPDTRSKVPSSPRSHMSAFNKEDNPETPPPKKRKRFIAPVAAKELPNSRLPHSPRSHMASFQEPPSPTELLLQALEQQENQYPVNDPSVLIEPELEVLPQTCTPAFRGMRGRSMALIASNVGEPEKAFAGHHLSNEKFRIDREQGRHYWGAFGIGSAFAALDMKVLEALRKVIPQRFHQVFPSAKDLTPKFIRERIPNFFKKIPFVGSILSWKPGTPGVTYMALGAGAMGQNEPFDDMLQTIYGDQFDMFSPASWDPEQSNYALASARPDMNINPALEFAGVSGSVAAGAISGHLLVSKTANIVAKYGKKVGGNWTTIGAGLIIPFLSTIYLKTLNNPARDILGNFQQILNLMIPPTEAGQGHVALSEEVKSKLPEILRILGQTFVITNWVSALELHSYCLPASNADGYTCEPLFPDSKADSDEKNVAQNQQNDDDKPDDTSVASEDDPSTQTETQPNKPPPTDTSSSSSSIEGIKSAADSCVDKKGISSFAADKELNFWQAFMNCRFYGGGSSCQKKYQCSLGFTDIKTCKTWASDLNEAKTAKGSGAFSQGTIDYYCEKSTQW